MAQRGQRGRRHRFGFGRLIDWWRSLQPASGGAQPTAENADTKALEPRPGGQSRRAADPQARLLPSSGPKHPALREVYWREEVFELALWLRGEEFGEQLSVDVLCRYLDLGPVTAGVLLERLASQGYLLPSASDRYVLTTEAERYAEHIVNGARAVPMPTTGACGATCWCSTSPVEAARCDAVIVELPR